MISSLLIGLAQTTSLWHTEESGYRSEAYLELRPRSEPPASPSCFGPCRAVDLNQERFLTPLRSIDCRSTGTVYAPAALILGPISGIYLPEYAA
jgi:hypothetical protein